MSGTPTAHLPAPAEDARLQIRFVVPPAFHEIPVFGTEDQVAEELWELVCEVLASEPDETRVRWAVALAGLIPPMAEAGVIHAGMCLVDVDGRPSTASIVASVCPLVGTDHAGAVDFLLTRLARSRPEAEVTAIELPAGRAAAVIDAVATSLDGGPTPLDGMAVPLHDGVLTTSVIQVHLPLPNESQLLSLELSTPCPEDWELYSELFADVVRSIHLEFADLPTVSEALYGPLEEPVAEAMGQRVKAAFG
ncbi:hypothetical protein [Streptomyces sp. CBMA156]|uniref:hypothetical protein n=1 Tax=Streptomyces sp. CBMA156 TaxID=1930280 RepID=UPI001661944E|nr:hypothetical protein [Streptomyces sp. CBMA156]MBD0670602.1 hypothetical protein [Streptomyces sp. CBMA156]